MSEQNKVAAHDACTASVIRAPDQGDAVEVVGHFMVECIGADGEIKWTEEFDNQVATVGKNLLLDTGLKGSSYTVTGPYLGLISSVNYSAVASADTMASHAGWQEAGNGTSYPFWDTPASQARSTMTFSAASAGSIATAAAASFHIATNAGTIKGAFVVFGANAATANNNTSGTLLSAGTFSGGDRAVATGDTVNVSYSLALTG